MILPFLYRSNEDSSAKGTFIGLTGYHSKKHLLRAVYEGIVFSHLTHVNRLLKNREKPESIRLSGGAVDIYDDYQDAITKTVRITKRIEPRIEYKGIYEKILDVPQDY